MLQLGDPWGAKAGGRCFPSESSDPSFRGSLREFDQIWHSPARLSRVSINFKLFASFVMDGYD